MLDLDFFGWMYLGFLLLPNGLERVKLRVERLEMTCFNLSGFYWVQTIIERDSCAITYYRGVEWRKMSGVKILFSGAIFCCSLLTGGVASCTSQSVYTFCLKCQDPFLPILVVYMERYVYCKRTWLWAQICLEDEKSNTLWYQTKYSSQVREDTLTKEDTLPKLKLKPNK